MALASSVGGGVRGAAFGLHGVKGHVSDVITDRLDMKQVNLPLTLLKGSGEGGSTRTLTSVVHSALVSFCADDKRA